MVRNYKPKKGARSYRNYSEEDLASAVEAITAGGLTYREASAKWGISVGTIINTVKGKHTKKPGHARGLSEKFIERYLETVSEWGFPFTYRDVQCTIQNYLNKTGRQASAFKNNMPSQDWVAAFVRRSPDLSHRNCQNIKVSRAKKTRKEFEEFYEEFKKSIGGVDENGACEIPPENFFNFDETNLTDDPGSQRCIFKKGVKYPERVMNSSKTSTSVMFCGSASGNTLPLYVVYKSVGLYSTWMEGGPKDTRYNRSKSGWFDKVCFLDWFENLFLRQIRHPTGPKV